MISTLALSTSIPLGEILWPSTIPFLTIKWHFSQFSTRWVSLHLYKTLLRFIKQMLKDGPKTEKSSMNISIKSSAMSEKIDIMHLWNVAGALHRPKV